MDEPTNGTRYRLHELERRLTVVEGRVEGVPVLRVEMNALQKQVGELAEDVRSLRRALYTAALSVTGGAVVFAATILQVLK